MAFKRALSATIKTRVVVMVANDAGGFDRNEFMAVFKRASLEEQEALRSLKNEEIVRRQLVGWELTDADTSEAVPFTPENLEALLSITPTGLATAVAFFEACSGARAKNL